MNAAYVPDARKPSLRDSKVASRYLQTWHYLRLLRANTGVSVRFYSMIGVDVCKDSCVLRRERWERREAADGRSFYVCRECGRFVGWVQ